MSVSDIGVPWFGYFLSSEDYREMIAAYGAEVLPRLRTYPPPTTDAAPIGYRTVL